MLKKNKNKKSSLLRVLQYLKGILSPEDRNAFEKELQKDSFEREALEGFESISPDQLEEDILSLNSKLGKRTANNNRIVYYRIAASVAVILTVSVLYLYLSDREIKEFPGTPEVTEAITQDSEKSKVNKVTEKDAEFPTPTESDISDGEQQVISTPSEKVEKESQEKSVNEVQIKEETISDEMEITEEREASPTPEISLSEEAETEVPATAEARPEEKISPETEKTAVKKDYDAAYATQAMTRSKQMAIPVSQKASEENIISGVVVSSEDNMPIPGASIMIKDIENGTVTDTEGRFQLSSTVENPTLIASFIGMEEVEIETQTGEDLEITMDPSSLAMEEVVVIGYGTQRRSETTGAISKIEDLENTIDNTWQGAYPEGGKREFKEYIEQNIVNPETEFEKAVVVLKFVVLPDGRPSSIQVLRSPGTEFSDEAIRLLEKGPKWIPAQNNGKYVADENRIRIVFRK